MTRSRDPDGFRVFELGRWQQVVGPYHRAWGDLTRQTIPRMLDILNVVSGTRLLDVACGPGYVSAEAAGRGADATGVDFSPSMVELADRLCPDAEFHEGDAEKLNFPGGFFDAVAMNFGMLHLARPEVAMREALRVLRTDGRFAFTVWAAPDRARGFAAVLDAVREHGQSVDVPHGPDFFHYSDPVRCRDGLVRQGFTAPHVEVVPMVWRLQSSADAWMAFVEGSARTGALLRGQPVERRERMAAAVQRALDEFTIEGGGIEVPMAAVLASALRP